MGIPGPQNARGAILYDLVKGAESLREVTILDISDYHGQLTPLSDTAGQRPGRHQPVVQHRRRGVPQDVVRHLHRRGRPVAAARTLR